MRFSSQPERKDLIRFIFIFIFYIEFRRVFSRFYRGINRQTLTLNRTGSLYSLFIKDLFWTIEKKTKKILPQAWCSFVSVLKKYKHFRYTFVWEMTIFLFINAYCNIKFIRVYLYRILSISVWS